MLMTKVWKSDVIMAIWNVRTMTPGKMHEISK